MHFEDVSAARHEPLRMRDRAVLNAQFVLPLGDHQGDEGLCRWGTARGQRQAFRDEAVDPNVGARADEDVYAGGLSLGAGQPEDPSGIEVFRRDVASDEVLPQVPGGFDRVTGFKLRKCEFGEGLALRVEFVGVREGFTRRLELPVPVELSALPGKGSRALVGLCRVRGR
jgi:hypothetical protein